MAMNAKLVEDGFDLFSKDKYSEAIPLLEQKAKIECPPADASLFLGASRSLSSGDRKYIDEAVKEVKGNLPEDHICSVYGFALWDMGLHDEGAVYLRKSVELNPSKGNLYVCVCRFDIEPALGEEALVYCNMLLANQPNDNMALLGRGCILEGKGLFAEALKDFKEASRIAPNEPGAHYEMGNVLVLMDDTEAALEEFRTAVRCHYWVLHAAQAGVALCLRDLGKLLEASIEVEKSLALKPDYQYALNLKKEIEQQIYWLHPVQE